MELINASSVQKVSIATVHRLFASSALLVLCPITKELTVLSVEIVTLTQQLEGNAKGVHYIHFQMNLELTVFLSMW